MTEAFARTKRLPALKSLIGQGANTSSQRQQTWQEMKAAMQRLTGGGE